MAWVSRSAVRSRYRLLLPEDGGGFVGRFWLDLSGITAAFKTSWSKDPRGKGELANDIRGCEAQRHPENHGKPELEQRVDV